MWQSGSSLYSVVLLHFLDFVVDYLVVFFRSSTKCVLSVSHDVTILIIIIIIIIIFPLISKYTYIFFCLFLIYLYLEKEEKKNSDKNYMGLKDYLREDKHCVFKTKKIEINTVCL